ncbi:hypothetical protein SB5439_04967 [Klebsiella variicola]|uniref:hypothetical protein n=1 Tax=Klebsiella variicola TaxID=244366 RepID=UPI00109C4BC4|nr:hypothetical protein [Klebsiella variicola]VGQ11572.1 hypothetical protein SB5439_04967 [Klebsiella variicola]
MTKRNLKIEKLLSKAFNNSSKDEATTAFGMAFSYAEQGGVRLADFRGDVRVVYEEKIVYREGGLNSEREHELVKKYNEVLARAKTLRADNDKLTTRANEAEYQRAGAERTSRALRNENAGLVAQVRAAVEEKALAEHLTGVQAVEISNLREAISKGDNKRTNYVYAALAVGVGLGIFITKTFIVPVAPIVPASAPVAHVAPVTTAPAPTYKEPTPLLKNVPTPQPAPAPVKVVDQEFNFPYGSMTKKGGVTKNLKIKLYADGSAYSSVNGDLTHISGDRYRAANGDNVRIERVNSFTLLIDGTAFIEDTIKGKSLAEVASTFRYYSNELYQLAIKRGGDLYITSANGRLVVLLAWPNGIQFTDINLIGEWRNYDKASESEGGTLVFNKRGGSGKYVEATGTDPAYGNIEITSFRGNAVYKVTP